MKMRNYIVGTKILTAKDIKADGLNSWGYPVAPVYTDTTRKVLVSSGFDFEGFYDGVSHWSKITLR